jgi:hypothetical protein
MAGLFGGGAPGGLDVLKALGGGARPLPGAAEQGAPPQGLPGLPNLPGLGAKAGSPAPGLNLGNLGRGLPPGVNPFKKP